MDRAQRFNVPLSRVTLTVEQQRRRVSISLDDEEAIAAVDPDMADALRLLRLNSTHDGTAVDATDAATTPFRRTGTDAVLAGNVIVSDGKAARIDRAARTHDKECDPGGGHVDSTDSTARIDAVETKLDAKLNGVNERLDSIARLLQSLAAGGLGVSSGGAQP